MSYKGFKKLTEEINKNLKIKNPKAIAAFIGRKKYGKKDFQKAAAKGVTMKTLGKAK